MNGIKQVKGRKRSGWRYKAGDAATNQKRTRSVGSAGQRHKTLSGIGGCEDGAKRAGERCDPRTKKPVEGEQHRSGGPTRESEKEACLRVKVRKGWSKRHAYG